MEMSLVEEALYNRPSVRFGLCPFSEKCELYYPHDYHCNQNRTIFLKTNPNCPNCYKEKKEE